MRLAPTPHAPDRFALIIDGLCRMIAASAPQGRLATPLILLVWTRLRRMGARFARLAARVRSGAVVRPARVRLAATSHPTAPRVGPRLPDGFGWLLRLDPEAACYGSQLQHLLSDPEMASLLSAAPQMGRVLRPLCRMLGVKAAPGLLPPPVARAQTHAETPTDAPPAPARAVHAKTSVAEMPPRRRPRMRESMRAGLTLIPTRPAPA